MAKSEREPVRFLLGEDRNVSYLAQSFRGPAQYTKTGSLSSQQDPGFCITCLTMVLESRKGA